MKPIFVISTVDELKALGAPQRLAMLRHLVDAALTATELAERMDEDKKRLYYHLGELEKLGLIEVVDTAIRRNLVEKTYRATARFYRVDGELFRGDGGSQRWLESIDTLLDTTASDLRSLIRNGLGDGGDDAIPDDVLEGVFSTHRGLAVPPARRAAFHARLEEVLAEFRVDEANLDAGNHRITIVAYPAPEPPSGE